MARTTAKAVSKAQAKPARKASAKPVAKAPPKRTSSKAAVAKRPAKKPAAPRPVARQPKGHVPPALKAAARARVARPRRGMHHEDAEQLPLPVEAFLPNPGADHLHGNWGETKNKAVARNDKPINWFRRSAKPPQK